MATVTTSSTVITNRDAVPPVLSNSNISNGTLREESANFAIATSDNIGSKWRLCRVPSNARVSQVLLSCTSSGTVGSVNLGIYKATRDNGSVVEADLFCGTKVLTTALKNSDVAHDSVKYDYTETEKMLWQVAGASVDPKTEYDVVMELIAVISSATTGNVKIRYVI